MAKKIRIPFRVKMEVTLDFLVDETESVEEATERATDHIIMARNLFDIYGMGGDMVGLNEDFLHEHYAEVIEMEPFEDVRVMEDSIEMVNE